MKKETFCRYIRQYETDMFRFAKSIVGTQADGEDAMQESILKAYENIDTLRSRRKFKAWIFQILANVLALSGASRQHRVAAPSIRFAQTLALASCWPRPQQLLPHSAAGGGRRRCSQRESLWQFNFMFSIPSGFTS